MVEDDLLYMMKVESGGYNIHILRGNKRIKTQYSLFKQTIGT